MRSNTRTQSSDSSNLIACAHHERPPLRLTLQGQQAITTGPKQSRVYTLTQDAYDELKKPLPMDALPHLDIKGHGWDEYDFTCVFCQKPISECNCGTGQE